MKLRRFVYPSDEASGFIASLHHRQNLSLLQPTEEMLGKSREVFGEPLGPAESVRRILQDVKEGGDAAVSRYSRLFDGVELPPERFQIDPRTLRKAYDELDKDLRRSLLAARDNIEAYQKALLPPDMSFEPGPGVRLGARFVPFRRTGVYVPGGTAAYPSSVLMNVIPAKVAGVQEIALFTPPEPRPSLLAASHMAGLEKVYRIGGVQAVGVMAYGTESVPPVDFIAGPGNVFVTLAKREVFGTTGIDMLAGPSEVMVIADSGQNAGWIAADLLAQAEHDPLAAAVLATVEGNLVNAVEDALDGLIEKHPRGRIAREALSVHGAAMVCRDLRSACQCANEVAPEHLELMCDNPSALLPSITAAGAVFLGSSTPEPVGDYVAGPSHTLPTGGTARFSSGLSALSFLRRMSVLEYAAGSLQDASGDVERLAEEEGLPYHAESVRLRTGSRKEAT